MKEVRPIDANALLECIRLAKEGCEEDGRVAGVAFANAMLNFLETDGAMPTIDYAPVRHGEWIYDFTLAGDKFYRCSVCGRQENIIEKEDINEHCPYCHCGAKMTWKGARNGIQH